MLTGLCAAMVVVASGAMGPNFETARDPIEKRRLAQVAQVIEWAPELGATAYWPDTSGHVFDGDVYEVTGTGEVLGAGQPLPASLQIWFAGPGTVVTHAETGDVWRLAQATLLLSVPEGASKRRIGPIPMGCQVGCRGEFVACCRGSRASYPVCLCVLGPLWESMCEDGGGGSSWCSLAVLPWDSDCPDWAR